VFSVLKPLCSPPLRYSFLIMNISVIGLHRPMEQINAAIKIRPTFDNLRRYPDRCLLQPSWSQLNFTLKQSSDVLPSSLCNIHRCYRPYTLHSRCQLDLLWLWLIHQRCCNVFEVCSVYTITRSQSAGFPMFSRLESTVYGKNMHDISWFLSY